MAENSMLNLCFEDARNMHLLIALSGGADSVALVHLLHSSREQLNLKLTAAHFHHGIRGAAADQDAAFCRELCASLQIPLIEEHGDVPLYAAENGMGLESAARKLRYEFLHRALHQADAEKIALAHHLNDQAETILMHLLRGSGMNGMCGMARMQGALYRPLLAVSKEELTQYLRNACISWREDATNTVSDNPRNALRLHVLPEMEKSYPAAARAIARYGAIARREETFLERLTDAFLREHLQLGPYGQRLRLSGNEEEVLLRRAVRKVSGEDLSAEQTDAIIALAKRPKGKLEISGRLMIERCDKHLYFLPKAQKKPEAVLLRIPGETVLHGVCRITAELGDFSIDPNHPSVQCLDADMLEGAQLRLRQNGDRIHPLGAQGSRLFSDCLIDQKIDRPLRDFLPVIARENDILCTFGAGISHAVRIQNHTRRRVRLTMIPITDE